MLLTCVIGSMLWFTQCVTQDYEPKPAPIEKPDPEPEPEPDPEPEPAPVQMDINKTMRMENDDYRALRHWSIYRKSLVESKNVTVIGSGDKLSIKGIFKKYPEAIVKGKVKKDFVHDENGPTKYYVVFDNGQIIAEEDGKPIYFHCGNVYYGYPHDSESVTQQFTFKPGSDLKIFEVTNDGKGIKITYDNLDHYNRAFWYDNDPEGQQVYYYKWQNDNLEGTGFPKLDDHIVNYELK